MTKDVVSALIDEVLVEGVDDWVPLFSVDNLAGILDPAAPPADRRALVARALTWLTDHGWADLGNIRDHTWRVLDEPRAEWRDVVDGLLRGPAEKWEYAIWLQLTEEGTRVAATRESILPDPYPDPPTPDRA